MSTGPGGASGSTGYKLQVLWVYFAVECIFQVQVVVSYSCLPAVKIVVSGESSSPVQGTSAKPQLRLPAFLAFHRRVKDSKANKPDLVKEESTLKYEKLKSP